jgi:nicotinate-nucleotide adenylyltransferase
MPQSSLQAFAAGQQQAPAAPFTLAVYGGAFDPPHAGHASVITRALDLAEQVLLVPSFCHADGKRMADFALRCDWLRCLAARFGERVSCSNIEQRLGAAGEIVYSYDLMQRLAQDYALPTARLALLIGEDNLHRLPGFSRAGKLRAEFGLLVAKEQLPVHSSTIRAMLAAGQNVPRAWQIEEIQEQLDCYRRCP